MSNSLHTISLFVSNKPGVLLRVTIIFARRGFNIESLVVSSAFDGKFSRMTISAKGSDKDLEQIVKQLSKLVDVIEARDNKDLVAIERELAIVKIALTNKNRQEVLQHIQVFNAKTIELTNDIVISEISGDSKKINGFLSLIKKYPVEELVRSGKMVMKRASENT